MVIKFSEGIFVSRFELDEFDEDEAEDDAAPGIDDTDDWGTANHAVGV